MEWNACSIDLTTAVKSVRFAIFGTEPARDGVLPKRQSVRQSDADALMGCADGQLMH